MFGASDENNMWKGNYEYLEVFQMVGAATAELREPNHVQTAN